MSVRSAHRYAFPGNIAELRDLVERAAVQAGDAAPQLNADVFWFATQARVDGSATHMRTMSLSLITSSLHRYEQARKLTALFICLTVLLPRSLHPPGSFRRRGTAA